MRRLTPATVAMALLAGCIPTIQYTPRTTVEMEASAFESTVTFLGIEQRYGGHALNRHFLRSWLDKESGGVSHQLYVVQYYGDDWRFWSRANGPDAAPLELTRISQDVISCSAYGGCLHSENFGVSIPDSALAANPSGYSLKVYARSGHDMVLRITGVQITHQRNEIHRQRERLGLAAPTTAVADTTTMH